jgi:nitroreductase
VIELIRQRRSIRAYTQESIAPETMELLIEALLRAPSSRNITPWEFVVVDDRELLSKLSASKEHGSAFLKGAAAGIVICADSSKSDVWVEDCSIAAILLQLTAQSLGLGSCWIQIRKRAHDESKGAEAYIGEQLGLPPHIVVECIVAFGHPRELRQPLPKEKLQYSKVKLNSYQQAYPAAP